MRCVGVIFGGPSPEHDVSVLTGLQAARELSGSGRYPSVVAIYWSTSGEWFEVPASLEAEAFVGGVPAGASLLRLVAGPGGGFVARGTLGRDKPLALDAVVNACHGGPGEDGTLQASLDLAGVPHAGPSVWGAAIGMDKLAFGGLVGTQFPVLPRVLLRAGDAEPFEGPYIVKPRFGGSSIGIQTVDSWTTAQSLAAKSPHLRRGAVVEPYRSDLFDLNIAMTVYPELAFSAIEKPVRSAGTRGDILDYRDKYVPGEGMVSAPRELPADIDPKLADSIREVAAGVADLCGVRGVSRLDFLSDGSEFHVNELNTIPGSLSKHLWVAPERSFSSLLADLLAEAVERPSSVYTTVGADGTVLRAAGSIAGKLG